VAQAAVLGVTGIDGDTALAAYVVPRGGADIDGALLRRELGERLPDYMIPATVTVLAGFPTTASGKVDRRRLPAPAAAAAGREAPGDPWEQLLAGLFAEVLGRPVGVHDDFFQLGGHSLTAARLVARIHAVLGIEPPLRMLFTAPTVATLARALRDGRTGDDLEPLLPLRPVGPATPVFCISPAGGLAWSYAGLTRYIPPEHPLFGLQDPGLTKPQDVDLDVAQLAEHHVEQIRRVRPAGPYHLVGWSAGGLVAHEMAVRLQADGQRVGLLAVLDAYPLAGHDSPTPRADEVQDAVRAQTAAFDLPETLVRSMAAVYARSARAAAHFTPQLFHGDLLHVRAAGEPAMRGLSARAWMDHITGLVDQHSVPCTHDEMTTPAALAQIGRLLADALARHDKEDSS
jgi:thioesterase domain-containing protein/acyl carrier protein